MAETFVLLFGLFGGVNLSTFVGAETALIDTLEGNVQPGYATNFTVGGKTVLEFNRSYGIRAELSVSVKGGTYERGLTGNNNRLETRMNMTYVELPVLGFYRLNEELTFMGGPYVSWYINGTAIHTLIVSGMASTGGSEPINYHDIAKPDGGMILGASYNIDEHISLLARYGRGLISIPADSDKDMHHGWFQLMLGLTF